MSRWVPLFNSYGTVDMPSPQAQMASEVSSDAGSTTSPVSSPGSGGNAGMYSSHDDMAASSGAATAGRAETLTETAPAKEAGITSTMAGPGYTPKALKGRRKIRRKAKATRNSGWQPLF